MAYALPVSLVLTSDDTDDVDASRQSSFLYGPPHASIESTPALRGSVRFDDAGLGCLCTSR